MAMKVWCRLCSDFTYWTHRKGCQRCLERGSKMRVAILIAAPILAFIYMVAKLWTR